MYAAEPTVNFPSSILPNRPISATPKILISLATPLESALPRNPTHRFVTPIESTPFFRTSPFFANCASVTPAYTTLTKHAPRNPCRMNTSTKHTGPLPLQIRQLIHTKELTPGSASRGQTTLRTLLLLFILTSLRHYFHPSRFPSSAIFLTLCPIPILPPCPRAKTPGSCSANTRNPSPCASTCSRSRPACAPTPANRAPTKRSGASPPCSTTSITNAFPTMTTLPTPSIPPKGPKSCANAATRKKCFAPS